jgi:hypothetical protein
MGNPATLENQAPTKILGQKTFLKRILTIGAHLGPNPRRQVAADVIVMANGKC